MSSPNQTEILDAAYEALNGLALAWNLANVKDEAKRIELQAPIIAGRDALLDIVRRMEANKGIS